MNRHADIDASQGVLGRSVHDTPVAVIDFETTGLYAGPDRVIEASVVRVEPGRKPQLVFDTLIYPRRPVAATFIHGITDEDVEDAPVFEEIAGDFVRAMAGCIVASYNVYFDMGFLEFELSNAGIFRVPPHVCLMYMRPMLSLGGRCRLEGACRAHGVLHRGAHTAAGDALAAAQLMRTYLAAMKKRGIETFGDLARVRSYKFARSFGEQPLLASEVSHISSAARTKSRYNCRGSRLTCALFS